MQKKRIFRARQNVTHVDLTSFQDYAQKTFDELVLDMLVSDKGYAGFTSVKSSSTNVTVAPGRLYDTGKVFSSDETTVVPLTSYLPAVAKKIVTLVVYGQEVDELVEPRDFLINVTTRATEPQSVPMVNHRMAIISPVAGIEAADPLPPAISSGYVPIATVVLNNSGIETVTMRSDTKVPELDAMALSLRLIYDWQFQVGRIIDGLHTDLANLSKVLQGTAGRDVMSAITQDLATLKEEQKLDRVIMSVMGADIANIKSEVNAINDARPDLEDLAAFYGADNFLDESESDVEHLSYLAKVEEGLRFAPDAQAITVLSVANPYNPLVTVSGTGLLTPKYSPIDGIVIGELNASAIASEVPLADYQYVTWEFASKTMSRQRIRYGDYFTVSSRSAYWKGGTYDPITQTFARDGETFAVNPDDLLGREKTVLRRFVRLQKVWVDTYEEPYWEWESATTTVQGSQVAETFLVPQSRYICGLSLGFTRIGPTGAVNVALCETNNDGSPNLNATLAQVSVPQANLLQFPQNWTYVPIQPTFVKQGKYAIVITTGGAHYVPLIAGNTYAQGTFFQGTDGDYLVGDATKDMALKVHYCKFERSSLTVDMTGLQLSGGISHIDLLAPMVVPEPSKLSIQVQISGEWKELAYNPNQDNGLSVLRGLPPLVPLRMVLTGTTDLLPVVDLSKSQVLVERPRTDSVHISTERTLPSGQETSRVTVTLYAAPFDTEDHTLVCKLRHGAGFSTVKTADASVLEEVTSRATEEKVMKKTFTFNMGTPISAYKIQIEGTTSSALSTFHVERREDNSIY